GLVVLGELVEIAGKLGGDQDAEVLVARLLGHFAGSDYAHWCSMLVTSSPVVSRQSSDSGRLTHERRSSRFPDGWRLAAGGFFPIFSAAFTTSRLSFSIKS